MQAANASAAPNVDVSVPTAETAIDDAQLEFGKAVDHYYAGEVAQALVLFCRLHTRYPDREEIQRAQTLCAKAIKQATPLPPQPSTRLLESIVHDESTPATEDDLTATTVRKFILHKMLHAENELAQIQAAEIAGRMVGLFPDERADDLQQAGNY